MPLLPEDKLANSVTGDSVGLKFVSGASDTLVAGQTQIGQHSAINVDSGIENVYTHTPV